MQYNITDRCYAVSVTNINRAVMRLVIADQLTAFSSPLNSGLYFTLKPSSLK